jgi:hypothetical protein
MTTETLTTNATSDGALRSVASFDTYAEVERAVDRLADQRFPMERVRVGRGLTLVEDVAGRRTFDRAAGEGAISGALIVGFVGLVSGLLNWFDPSFSAVLLALYGVAFGAAVGALVGLLGHALLGGRRDFSSARSLKAGPYEVLAEAEVAEDARDRLTA